MARLAAFDMDGTLLMPDHHLGEKTLSTLARLRERDITLTFATGASCAGDAAYSRGAIAGCIFDYRQRNARAFSGR